jgi:hypothetical protein
MMRARPMRMTSSISDFRGGSRSALRARALGLVKWRYSRYGVRLFALNDNKKICYKRKVAGHLPSFPATTFALLRLLKGGRLFAVQDLAQVAQRN